MARVVVAMSGGVDSSVAAHLLRRAGHDVIGLFMRHGQVDGLECGPGNAQNDTLLPIVDTGRQEQKKGCCSAADAADARRVADLLELPFYALNLEREFAKIVDYFVDEYASGRTPNPCVACNNDLKFGTLVEYADAMGADFIATGHYARLERGETIRLRRAIDARKDQSYVLFGIRRDLLPRILFPVGDYFKEAIRAMARQFNLAVAEKPESQEICFVPRGKHADFVRARRRNRPTAGDLVTTDGQIIGEHDGIERFTIGQRKGLGISFGEPRYVVRIDARSNQVVIGRRDDLLREELTARQVNWLVDPFSRPRACQVRIRYGAPSVTAVATPLPNDRLHVRFKEPQAGVAPGQAVVCYDGDYLLGGGWIE